MDGFVPADLTRRQVTSKYASIFDPTGKLGPVLAEAKLLLSETIEATPEWDAALPAQLRSKWLSQFMLWEKLRGLKFDRAVMPEDAIDSKLRLIILADFSNRMASV